jgi:hypothetical protein
MAAFPAQSRSLDAQAIADSAVKMMNKSGMRQAREPEESAGASWRRATIRGTGITRPFSASHPRDERYRRERTSGGR